MRATGLFIEHPLGNVVHREPNKVITHRCPKCDKEFTGPSRTVLYAYREHVLDEHQNLLSDTCGCCGAFHFPEFDGDCREDWERF